MEPSEVGSWARNQGRQAGNEVQGVEHDVRCAVAKGLFEVVHDLTTLVGQQPFVRNRRSGDIAAEFFQLVASFGLTACGRMKRETGLLGEQG